MSLKLPVTLDTHCLCKIQMLSITADAFSADFPLNPFDHDMHNINNLLIHTRLKR